MVEERKKLKATAIAIAVQIAEAAFVFLLVDMLGLNAEAVAEISGPLADKISAALMLYVVGQGIADAGKERAKIELLGTNGTNDGS